MTDDQDKQEEPRKPAKGQKEFDWTRATRQKWLDRLDIPEFKHAEANGTIRKVRTFRLTLFLQTIETFTRDGGEWQLSEERMSKSHGNSSIKTIQRLVTICEARGLLNVRRVEGQASWYSINWTEVKEILLSNPKTEGLVLMPTKQVAKTTPDNLSATPDNLTGTPVNLSATPDNLSATDADRTYYPARAEFNHQFNHEIKLEIKPCTEVPEKQQFEPLPPTNGGWSRPLSLRDFHDSANVNRLWDYALKFRYVTKPDRFRFWTLAKYVSRLTVAGLIREPGAYFTAQLIAKNWLGDAEDARAARLALAILDRGRGYD